MKDINLLAIAIGLGMGYLANGCGKGLPPLLAAGILIILTVMILLRDE